MVRALDAREMCATVGQPSTTTCAAASVAGEKIKKSRYASWGQRPTANANPTGRYYRRIYLTCLADLPANDFILLDHLHRRRQPDPVLSAVGSCAGPVGTFILLVQVVRVVLCAK